MPSSPRLIATAMVAAALMTGSVAASASAVPVAHSQVHTTAQQGHLMAAPPAAAEQSDAKIPSNCKAVPSTKTLFGIRLPGFLGDWLHQFISFLFKFLFDCIGGGGSDPFPQPTPTTTPTSSPTIIQPTPTGTITPSPTGTTTPTTRPTTTPTNKPMPTITDNPRPTSTSTIRPTSTPTATATPTTNPGTGNLDPELQKVLQIVNQERAKAGAPALLLDTCMTTKPAQNWANHMAKVKRMYHQPMSNVTRDCPGLGYAGENIAMGQRDAQQVMRAWMNSSGHRRNILGRQYTHIGLGLARDDRGTPYWVQNFGSRK